jgi:HAD superfamily hydrolase (TIGR01509 family)
MTIELIIFDCDGVLVDSETVTNAVLGELILELGGSAQLVAKMEQFTGMTLPQTFAAIEQGLGHPLPKDFLQTYRQKTFAAYEQQLQPIAGIHEALSQIELPICVASNSPRHKMHLCLARTGLLPYFGGRMFSCYDIQRWKPDPAIYRHAAATMGVAPTHCVVVEDSVVGVQVAVAAKMTVLGYTGSYVAPTLEAAGARVFDRMIDLPPLLNEIWGSSI